MADLPTIRALVNDGIRQRDVLADQAHVVGSDLGAARRERNRLRDGGAAAADVQAAEDRVQSLLAERDGLTGRLSAVRDDLATTLIELFGTEIDLEGDVPLVLLPVRVEVRSTADQSALRVRIFPDAVHTEALETGLTEAEAAAGRDYWSVVWAGGDPQAPWPALQAVVGLKRAPWVAEALRPTNLIDRPAGDPDFPAVAAPGGRPSTVRTLPDRFLVRVEQDGAAPVTVATRPIPDEVPVGLVDVDQLEVLSIDGDDVPALDASMRWLVDYDEAVALGLAITVTLPVAGQDVVRLVVYGVRASLDAEAGAARLETLLRSHRFSDGAEFLPQGTPTNNTDTAAPAWSRRTPLGPPSLTPTATLPAGSNAAVTAAALGVDPALIATLAGAVDQEQTRASAFATALWSTTWGDAIEMLTPEGRAEGRLDSPSLDAVRDHWVDHVRGRGPLPALRIGRQPYGLLPIVVTDRSFAPRRGDVPETRLVPFLRDHRWMWEDAVQAVPTVMNGPLDVNLPTILGTDAVLRGLRVRSALSPDPVLWTMVGSALGGFDGLAAQQELSRAVTLLAGVGNDALEDNLLTGKKTRTLALPLVDASDPEFASRLADDAPTDPPRSVLQVLLAHADAVNADAITRVAAPEALDGTLRAAVNETRTDVDRDLVTSALQAVQAGAFDDGVVLDASRHLDERVGVLDRQLLSALHPLPGLAPATVVQQLAGEDPQVAQLTGVNGMRVVGELFRGARWRARFRDALRTIATIGADDERRLLLAETLDCCSHRLDAWIISIASRRLADLRATTPTGLYLGAYGVLEHITLSRPDAAGQIDGREVLHDPGDGGYVHAPGLAHAATAGVLRSGRLTHRRGDPDSEALDIDLSSTRVRDAVTLLDGMRRGQSLGALLGYRLERRLHERSGGGLELDRFVYVLRSLAPLRVGKLTEPDQPAQESVAASDVVDGLRLLAVPTTTITAKLAAGPDDATYIVAWQGPQGAEEAAVLAEIADLARTHDAVADLLLAESVHQIVSGNPGRAAAALDALAAGESVPPDPEVVWVPRTGVPIQHRVALLVSADTPAQPGWAAGTPRALAEPRLEVWAETALGDPAALTLADGDGRTLADAGLSALDVIFDADGDAVTTSTLALRLRLRFPDLAADLAPLAVTWELAGLLRGLLVAGRPLDVDDLGRAVDDPAAATRPVGRLPDVAELLGRAQAARDGLADALASADVDALLPYGVHRPPLVGPPPTPQEQQTTVVAALDHGGRRVADADLLLSQIATATAPRTQVALAAQVLDVVFGSPFVALPVLLPPPAGEADLWADAIGPGGVHVAPGATIRPWLARSGTTRAATSAYGETLLVREAYGSGPRLRVVQAPAAAYGSWVGLPFPGGRPPMVPISSTVAEVVGDGDLAGSVAGLVLDGWTEVVPRRLERGDPLAPDEPPTLVDVTTTGMAVHANGPGARPPQSILLAMTPDGGHWTADRLLAVVDETVALARIRCVTLPQIPFAGRYLPALYFRDWSLQGEPVVAWARLATEIFTPRAALSYLAVKE
ncbi:MAG: hypothetical protein ACR2LI_06080 [Propionibacteriaceae bacterium]